MMPIGDKSTVMSDKLPKSAQKVADKVAALGLGVRIVEMPESTRTATEAASACGCRVGQIVKSLVFRGRQSGRAVLILASGDNRVDVEFVAGDIGEKIERPDANWVRAETGFAIGGIPPIGHDRPLTTFMDRALTTYTKVWAAAGTPNCVMEIDARDLASASNAHIIDVC